jgi:hypothetical protein
MQVCTHVRVTLPRVTFVDMINIATSSYSCYWKLDLDDSGQVIYFGN